MTVKTRITLLITGAGLIASLLFSVVVFFEFVEQPFELLDTVLKEEAYQTVWRVVEAEGKGRPAIPVDHAMAAYWVRIHEEGTDRPLYQSPLAKSIRLAPVKPDSSAILSVPIPPGQDNRVITLRVKTFRFDLKGKTFVVQIARTMEKLEEEIRDLVMGIVFGLVLSTLALIAISRFVAGRILRPIGAMKDLAQDISEKNLDQRIPVGKARDEFSQLAKTINHMLDRLQYSFARQRDFLFDTSHELKTPLTSIRLAVDEIRTRDRGNLPPFAEENLARLNHQVWRMERLVKDLLNLSSLETLPRIDPGPVYITRMLTSLAEEYQFLAEAHQISIRTRLPEGLVIQGDREKLNRAFSNILDNALKYNVDGGWIDVESLESDGDLVIRVTNSGPGLAEEDIPRAFDQFFRVEKSRSEVHGGSGLGLAIVKRIVALHHGEVALESEQGAWTRITIRLPGPPETAAP
ncbi:MAG: HAMP domain-containing sensor histidine kinase [Deltaproteobacteria bacterium]